MNVHPLDNPHATGATAACSAQNHILQPSFMQWHCTTEAACSHHENIFRSLTELSLRTTSRNRLAFHHRPISQPSQRQTCTRSDAPSTFPQAADLCLQRVHGRATATAPNAAGQCPPFSCPQLAGTTNPAIDGWSCLCVPQWHRHTVLRAGCTRRCLSTQTA